MHRHLNTVVYCHFDPINGPAQSMVRKTNTESRIRVRSSPKSRSVPGTNKKVLSLLYLFQKSINPA
jgi:hypothetical protein